MYGIGFNVRSDPAHIAAKQIFFMILHFLAKNDCFFLVSGAPPPPTTHHKKKQLFGEWCPPPPHHSQKKCQLFWWVVPPSPHHSPKNINFLVTGSPLPLTIFCDWCGGGFVMLYDRMPNLTIPTLTQELMVSEVHLNVLVCYRCMGRVCDAV